MIIGFARAIVIVLSEGQGMDTILYYALMIFDSLLHIVIPSGSGMDALTMPIIAPLADIVGITTRTSVLLLLLETAL